MALQGTLVKYGPLACHVAFITGAHKRHFILIGGLGDGMLFAPYKDLLAEHLARQNWSLVQTLLSSSHQGYGVGSLDKDAQEIHLLARYLKATQGSQAVVLMGHSTGCQDAVRYAQRYGHAAKGPPVLAYILQAPASDREAISLSNVADDLKQERLIAAQLMVTNGEAEEILYRDPDMQGAPVCARRYVSLVSVSGDDDMFSSDFTDEQLQEKLLPLKVAPSLLLIGGEDEFVPKTVDKEVLAQRMQAAIGSSAEALVIPGGNHKLEGKEEAVVQHVSTFLDRLTSVKA